MSLLRKLEIDCPYCHSSVDKNGANTLVCPYCKTTIELSKGGEILDYEVPEFHGTIVMILSITSFILLVVILVDALLSENPSDKLVPIGIILASVAVGLVWIPFKTGFSFMYSRLGIMIGLTLILLLFLILNIGDFIYYN